METNQIELIIRLLQSRTISKEGFPKRPLNYTFRKF